MKFALSLVGLFALMFYNCQKSAESVSATANVAARAASETAANNVENNSIMNKESVYADKVGDLRYKFNVRLIKKGQHNNINYASDYLYVDYEIENRGAKDFLLFNQGHTDRADRAIVYTEAAANDVIELSQKAFAKPVGKNCPLRDAPILPRARLLKPNEIVKEQIGIALPFVFNTPFADCSPKSELPANPSRARFCLGVAEIESGKVKVDQTGNVTGWNAFAAQKLLCSELIELQ